MIDILQLASERGWDGPKVLQAAALMRIDLDRPALREFLSKYATKQGRDRTTVRDLGEDAVVKMHGWKFTRAFRRRRVSRQ